MDYPSLQGAVLTQLVQAHLPLFIVGGEAAIHDLHRKPTEEALLLSSVSEAFWNAGQRSRALRLNEKARLLAPQEGEIYVQQAIFLINSGQMTQAVRWLRMALALCPGHGEAQFLLNRLERTRQ
jgi:tetratricopeptide (TPR) repeat protein